MQLQTIRTHAFALEAVTEEPHHHFSSFRVRGKIFVTIPPGGETLHVLLGDDDRDRALATWPGFVETLTWGGKAVGVRVQLASANPAAVKSLVTAALPDAGAQGRGAEVAAQAQGCHSAGRLMPDRCARLSGDDS